MYGRDGGRKGSEVSEPKAMKIIPWIKKVENCRSEMRNCPASVMAVYGSESAGWPWTSSVAKNGLKAEEGGSVYAMVSLKIDVTVAVSPRATWSRKSKKKTY